MRASDYLQRMEMYPEELRLMNKKERNSWQLEKADPFVVHAE